MDKFKVSILRKNETPIEGIVTADNPAAALFELIQAKKADPDDFKSIFVSNINL